MQNIVYQQVIKYMFLSDEVRCFRNTNNHLTNKQSDKTLLSLSSILYHAFLNNHAESFSRGDTVNFSNFLNF